MGGGMPYQLEKGPGFSITEAVLESVDARIELLLRMRIGVEQLEEMPSLDDAGLDAGPFNYDDRVKHQNKHWFGKTLDTSTVPPTWRPQPAFNLQTNRTTGYWYNWYGDAEGIVREGFSRAIEVSLGIPHDPNVKERDRIHPTHDWPIEVFWRCPAPWLEAWVTWKVLDARAQKPPKRATKTAVQDAVQREPVEETDRRGHVTMHIHTPSHKHSALILTPIRSDPYRTWPEYGEHPDLGPPPRQPLDGAPYGDRGMWVVAQKDQKEYLNVRSGIAPSPKGQWQYPSVGPSVKSEGQIVVVQPNEPDGGVLPGGRPYEPIPR